MLTVLLGLLADLALAFTVALVRKAAERKQLAPSLEAIGLGALPDHG